MKFGLSDSQYQILQNLVINPLKAKGAQVYIFGSRARGKHHPFSDIDVLYSLNSDASLSKADLSQIIESIEESNFAIKVDLVRDADLAQSYRDSVNSEKILL